MKHPSSILSLERERKERSLWTSLGLFLIVTGTAFALGCSRPSKRALPERELVTVSRRDVALLWKARGLLTPGHLTAVTSPLTARIEAVLVQEGQGVETGQPLVKLKADEGMEGPFRQPWQSDVVSPSVGKAVSVSAKPGNVVFGIGELCLPTVLLRIEEGGQPVFRIKLTKADAGLIKPGLIGTILFDEGETQQAKVEALSTIDGHCDLVPLVQGEWLGAGGGLVCIQLDAHKNVLTVPVQSIGLSYGSAYVIRIENGTEKPVLVKPGLSDGDWVSILDGLSEGDRLLAVWSEEVTRKSE